MEYKVNIGDVKSGKSYKVMIVDDEAKSLLGAKIGDKVKGDKFGFSGYEFEITGGSDSSGFPMRKDVRGSKRQRILIVSGIGTRQNRKGMRLRRTVVGNTVGQKTSQVNMKVLKAGKKPLDASPTEEAPAEDTREKSPEVQPEAKPPKEEAKPEEKPKAEEKPKEDKKEEAPTEKPKEEKPSEEKKKE